LCEQRRRRIFFFRFANRSSSEPIEGEHNREPLSNQTSNLYQGKEEEEEQEEKEKPNQIAQ